MTAPLALDMFAKSVFRQTFKPIRRSIGRIRPHVLARVAGKDLLKHLAIMLGRVRHRIASDQLVLHLHRDVVLIAVKGFTVFLGLSHVHVFLSSLVLRSVFRDFACFYPGVFFPAVASLGHVHDTGVDNLPLHGHETVGPEVCVEGRKQLLHDAGLDEVFAKTPDRGGIRDFLADVQTEKTPEGVPVEDLKFGRVVRQVIQRLQNENFEQQDGIVPLRTNIGLPVFVPSLPNFGFPKTQNYPSSFFIRDFSHCAGWR